ncbi:MAG: hypothetical protein AAAFM81_00345 [Pseudomonadota bacterium]
MKHMNRSVRSPFAFSMAGVRALAGVSPYLVRDTGRQRIEKRAQTKPVAATQHNPHCEQPFCQHA